MLILGSLPGDASLAAGQYYAHPQNRFWHLVGGVIECDLAGLDYDSRMRVLLEVGVGLWDTVTSAHRRGSLDSAIRQVKPAPLTQLVTSLPNLRAIGFNGKAAARIGRAQLSDCTLTLIDLPSSSPAYAAMPLPEKTLQWERLGDFLA